MPRKIKNTEDINEPVMVDKEQDITPTLEPEKAESIITSSEEEAIEKKPRKPRVKKPRTEAQLKAFERASKIRLENLAKLREKKKIEEDKNRKELEEHSNKIKLEQEQEKKLLKEKLERKIIDKAIKIKKKKMKQIKEIDDVSSDSDTKETVKKAIIQIDPYKAFKDKYKVK